MTVYVVVDGTPKNQEKLKEYAVKAPVVKEKYDGEFLAKGQIKT